jgi:hypothetical protein
LVYFSRFGLLHQEKIWQPWYVFVLNSVVITQQHCFFRRLKSCSTKQRK